ncbi:MAG: IS5/IS1182 family transposase, partial [Hyphomicrobium sp.]
MHGISTRSVDDLVKEMGMRVVGYNVQCVVETKHHLFVAHEVANHGYDRNALSMMAHAAEDFMASDAIEAIADKGYY